MRSVGITDQEERKREVKPAMCAKGHAFREAVNRKKPSSEAGKSEGVSGSASPARTSGPERGAVVYGQWFILGCCLPRADGGGGLHNSMLAGEALGFCPSETHFGLMSILGPHCTANDDGRGSQRFCVTFLKDCGHQLEVP